MAAPMIIKTKPQIKVLEKRKKRLQRSLSRKEKNLTSKSKNYYKTLRKIRNITKECFINFFENSHAKFYVNESIKKSIIENIVIMCLAIGVTALFIIQNVQSDIMRNCSSLQKRKDFIN